MTATEQLASLRPAGFALLATGIPFMIGAGAAAYFRRFPLPTDPLEQLTLSANDRSGWSAQAIIFPICFVTVAMAFGWMAVQLPAGWPRWLAVAAVLASVAARLLWLPISANRLQLAAHAAKMIASYDPAAPPAVFRNTGTFWPYTLGSLAGIAAFLLGMLSTGPTSKKLGLLAGQLGAAGGLPTPAQAAELGPLQAKLATSSTASTILTTAALALMAVPRYLEGRKEGTHDEGTQGVRSIAPTPRFPLLPFSPAKHPRQDSNLRPGA